MMIHCTASDSSLQQGVELSSGISRPSVRRAERSCAKSGRELADRPSARRSCVLRKTCWTGSRLRDVVCDAVVTVTHHCSLPGEVD